jgi:hypothetical protein
MDPPRMIADWWQQIQTVGTRECQTNAQNLLMGGECITPRQLASIHVGDASRQLTKQLKQTTARIGQARRTERELDRL